MSEDLEVRLVDTIASEINGNVDLPDHSTVRYGRPLVVLPDDCPLLCVWLLQKAMVPRTTNYFDSTIAIGVSWQVWTEREIESLQEDEERRKRTLKEMLRIQARIRYMGVHGLSEEIGEAYEFLPVGVDYTPPSSLETGLVEGYAMTVHVNVQESG